MAMEVTQILLNAQSADGSVRKHAEESLEQFQEQNLPGFLSSLSAELANEEKPIDSRKLSGLILKIALDAKEQDRKFEPVQRWLSLDVSIKTQIKSFLLQTLSSPVHEARSTASQVIAKVAGIEVPQKEWPELITSLLSNIHEVPTDVKQATLETVGYIFGEVPCVDEPYQVPCVDEPYQVPCVDEPYQSKTHRGVFEVLQAMRARTISVARANFFNDLEGDYVMKVVLEEIISPEVKIRQAAFECLVVISSSYYEKLSPYIQDICSITAKAVKEGEGAVAEQAIEFLNWICGVEIGIICGKNVISEIAGIPCIYFIKRALPALVPMLLETLLKQEEDQDEDEDEGAWNLSRACRQCLMLVARTVGDDIVPLVMPFIEANIRKPDWRLREGATYAFGSILDCSILEGPSPNKYTHLVNIALYFLLKALERDSHNHVKVTTAWALGRIFELVILSRSIMESAIITSDNFRQIIDVLLLSMKDAPNVAEEACEALSLLVNCWYRNVGQLSSLTSSFQEITQTLLIAAHREDSSGGRLRRAVYKTLDKVVRYSNDETAPMVLQLVPLITMELHKTLEDDNLSEVQRHLCGCLQGLIQKLRSSDATRYVLMQYTDQIMSLLVRYAPQIVKFLELKDMINMFESFSIQSEIMKRLPVESLIRFRSVSKAWKNLIESSEFIIAHSQQRHTHPRHLLVSRLSNEVVCLSSYSDDDTFPGKLPSALTAPSCARELVVVKVVGSSHGVICLHGFDFGSCTSKALLWNPSIRKSVVVPFPGNYPHIGFGVCPVTCAPKLVWFGGYERSPKVFTLKSGGGSVWKPITRRYDDGCWSATITTKNFIYSRAVCDKILSFHLTSETFGAVDLPGGLTSVEEYGEFYMTIIRESLALIVSMCATGTTFAVWLLEEDGVQTSFTKMFNIITPSKFDQVLGSSKNDMLIMLQANPDDDDDDFAADDSQPPSLVVFEPNSGHTNVLKSEEEGLTCVVSAQTKALEIKGVSYDIDDVYAYEETLLLLDCHHYSD